MEKSWTYIQIFTVNSFKNKLFKNLKKILLRRFVVVTNMLNPLESKPDLWNVELPKMWNLWLG